jgi:drug/metabolite transporter (DMT)-like permease
MMPLSQFMVLRALFCILIFVTFVPRADRRGMLRHVGDRLVVLRGLFEAVSVLCYVLALQSLPLATVTSIYAVGPIFTICAAAALGMTRLNARLVLSVALAFGGVLLVAMPREAGLSGALGLAFASAVLVAGRDLATRAMPPGVPSSSVAIVTMTCVGLAGAALAPMEAAWTMSQPWLLVMIALGATCTAAGNYLVILAFRAGDPGLMSVLRYAAIPIAMVFGVLLFDNSPGPVQILGAAMVIAGGSLAIMGARRHG